MGLLIAIVIVAVLCLNAFAILRQTKSRGLLFAALVSPVLLLLCVVLVVDNVRDGMQRDILDNVFENAIALGDASASAEVSAACAVVADRASREDLSAFNTLARLAEELRRRRDAQDSD